MQEGQIIQNPFDKRKISIVSTVVILLVVVGFIGYHSVFLNASGQNPVQNLGKSVQGASTQNSNNIQMLDNNTQDIAANSSQQAQLAAQQKINQIQQELSTINVTNIATSSPQIQKIINDIQSLQQLPSDQTKAFCEKICGSK